MNQMPHNVVSDQGPLCLPTGFSIKNRIKVKNRPDTPKMIKDSSNILQLRSPPVYSGFKEEFAPTGANILL